MSHREIPAPTLRGAIAAAFWRTGRGASQSEFDALMASVRVSNAAFGDVLPLDRLVCKYHRVMDCQCGANSEFSKGEVLLEGGLRVVTQTRGQLTDREHAKEGALFQREALVGPGVQASAVVSADRRQDLERLGLSQGAVLRVGRGKSVSGRCTVSSITEYDPGAVTGASCFRVVLRTPGIFVDEWGFASPRPHAEALRRVFGVSDARVTDSRIRWTTVGGWHAKADRPKPQDSAVMAGSVFLVETGAPLPKVPGLVSDFGLGGAEGYGWAHISGEAQ